MRQSSPIFFSQTHFAYLHCQLWCCCCHGNRAGCSQPKASFSNAIKCEYSLWKIIHNGPILMKLCQHVLGVRFLSTVYMQRQTLHSATVLKSSI